MLTYTYAHSVPTNTRTYATLSCMMRNIKLQAGRLYGHVYSDRAT
jgi:hypothetical protein